jgi:quercetin dioxygenase-like cupin family protein
MDILDAVSIRLPCNACGQTYEVPLRDVLLSHTVVRCGCPVAQETECPPVFQIRLFDRAAIEDLSSAWEQLAGRAQADGGELVISAIESKPRANDITGTTGELSMNQHEDHAQDGRIRQLVATSGTLLSFDIAEEVRRLQSEQPWQAEHTANTIVKYPDLRIVLIALKAGGRLHEHQTAGRLSIQALSGEIHVHVDGQVIEMNTGKLLTLDHDVPHDVEAKTDSVFLLTIAWPK